MNWDLYEKFEWMSEDNRERIKTVMDSLFACLLQTSTQSVMLFSYQSSATSFREELHTACKEWIEHVHLYVVKLQDSLTKRNNDFISGAAFSTALLAHSENLKEILKPRVSENTAESFSELLPLLFDKADLQSLQSKIYQFGTPVGSSMHYQDMSNNADPSKKIDFKTDKVSDTTDGIEKQSNLSLSTFNIDITKEGASPPIFDKKPHQTSKVRVKPFNEEERELKRFDYQDENVNRSNVVKERKGQEFGGGGVKPVIKPLGLESIKDGGRDCENKDSRRGVSSSHRVGKMGGNSEPNTMRLIEAVPTSNLISVERSNRSLNWALKPNPLEDCTKEKDLSSKK